VFIARIHGTFCSKAKPLAELRLSSNQKQRQQKFKTVKPSVIHFKPPSCFQTSVSERRKRADDGSKIKIVKRF
jgi:hypothetical protein